MFNLFRKVFHWNQNCKLSPLQKRSFPGRIRKTARGTVLLQSKTYIPYNRCIFFSISAFQSRKHIWFFVPFLKRLSWSWCPDFPVSCLMDRPFFRGSLSLFDCHFLNQQVFCFHVSMMQFTFSESAFQLFWTCVNRGAGGCLCQQDNALSLVSCIVKTPKVSAVWTGGIKLSSP